MSKLTTNLKMVKPDYTDAPDIGVLNENFDTLDEQVTYLRALGGMVTAPQNDYIIANGLNGITIRAGVVFTIGTKIVVTTATNLSVSGTLGNDYKVYAVLGSNGDVTYSIAQSAPAGTTVLLGGFHYGRVRQSSSSVVTGVVPNSVWTQLHRPKCDPTGMAYAGNGLWADIYIMSGNPVVSKYGASPRVNITWYDTWNLLRAQGKRMPSYGEWITLSEGSPEGLDSSNNNAWSATSNTGAGTTGNVANAISNLNIVDCVGRVWEWVDELCLDPTAATWGWQDVGGAGYGDMYIPSNTALRALICGGFWNFGVHVGSRAVSAGFYPWVSDAYFSGRGVCDSL